MLRPCGVNSAMTGIPFGKTLARWPNEMTDTTTDFISLIRGDRVEEVLIVGNEGFLRFYSERGEI